METNKIKQILREIDRRVDKAKIRLQKQRQANDAEGIYMEKGTISELKDLENWLYNNFPEASRID